MYRKEIYGIILYVDFKMAEEDRRTPTMMEMVAVPAAIEQFTCCGVTLVSRAATETSEHEEQEAVAINGCMHDEGAVDNCVELDSKPCFFVG